MTWWQVLILVVDLYLMLSLGSWILLQILEWVLQRSGSFLAAETQRLKGLGDAEHSQSSAWPQEARPGRYQESDRLAQECLTRLRLALDEANRLWLPLSAHVRAELRLGHILCLGSWGPLLRATVTWRDMRLLQKILDEGTETLALLEKQQRAVRDIPARVRALLNETRAEASRLSALLEAEEEVGTLGLAETAQRLRVVSLEIERALDRLAEATPDQLPSVAYEIDVMLNRIVPSVEEMDHFISGASSARTKAQNIIARVDKWLQLADERWEGLKARGATEPSIGRTLATLQTGVAHLVDMAQQRTLDVYHQIDAEVSSLDPQLQSLMNSLDALDALIRESKEAIEGDVQALADAQATCDELVRREPLLDLDQSQTLIEKATEAYMEAERQRGLGTVEGYQATLAASQSATRYLSLAMEAAEPLSERADHVRDLLASLTSDILSDWRSRIDRVREQLRIYARHWDSGLAGDVGEAVSYLDQVEVDLERIPPNVRYQRRLRQSELAESIEILSHGRECMERAKGLIADLEEERVRIENLRGDLERVVEELAQDSFPAMQEQSQRMLPELQQRLQTLHKDFGEHVEMLGDPAQAHYDDLASEWLPTVLRQLEDIRATHEKDVQHYRKALRDAINRLDRRRARLKRLSPYEQPGPEEEIERLVADLDNWRANAEQQEENPLALQEIVGRQCALLEQRIEAAQRQISEGRRTLDALAKEYRKHSGAVHNLRNSIRNVQRESRWTQLDWETNEAERVWEKALAFERDCRMETTLVQANNQLQLAVNAAQQAEQLYGLVEHRIDSATRRLNEEFREATAALRRGRHRAKQLREQSPDGQGHTEESLAIEELCARATRTIEVALEAATFEDALRYLRDAGNMLTRI